MPQSRAISWDTFLKIRQERTSRVFLLLENVPNLKRHNSGETWLDLERQFKRAGYTISSAYLSPHDFGIPQIRERLFIVGSRDGLANFKWPIGPKSVELDLKSILDKQPKDARALSPVVVECMTDWQKFIERFPPKKELPSFPIWSMEFGATYPFEETSPWATPRKGWTVPRMSRETA